MYLKFRGAIKTQNKLELVSFVHRWHSLDTCIKLLKQKVINCCQCFMNIALVNKSFLYTLIRLIDDIYWKHLLIIVLRSILCHIWYFGMEHFVYKICSFMSKTFRILVGSVLNGYASFVLFDPLGTVFDNIQI